MNERVSTGNNIDVALFSKGRQPHQVQRFCYERLYSCGGGGGLRITGGGKKQMEKKNQRSCGVVWEGEKREGEREKKKGME